jgi:hypothetical protein
MFNSHCPGAASQPAGIKKIKDMGSIKKGLMGPFSGRVGNLVGYSCHGRNYLRSRPVVYRDAKTSSQLGQRTGFRLVQDLVCQLLPFIRIGFRGAATTSSPYCAALGYNMRHALAGEYPDLEIDYGRVLLSRGSLEPVEDLWATLSGLSVLEVGWSCDQGDGADNIMVVVYEPHRQLLHYSLQAGMRSGQKAVLHLPWEPQVQQLQVWVVAARLECYLVNPGERDIANSRNIQV